MTAPLRRRGPRPLPLHLGLLGMRAMAAMASPDPRQMPSASAWPPGWPRWSGDWPISKAGRQEASRIAEALDTGIGRQITARCRSATVTASGWRTDNDSTAGARSS